jgi:hypothetical protein
LSAFIISSNANGVIPFFCHLSTTPQAMQEACSFEGKRNFGMRSPLFWAGHEASAWGCRLFDHLFVPELPKQFHSGSVTGVGNQLHA